MRHFEGYRNIYFIGIGGIGMSALARFFKKIGKKVGGYDRAVNSLTDELIRESIEVVFDEEEAAVPVSFTNPGETLVIYTPAVPATHPQLRAFRKNEFRVLKRSQALGLITRDMNSICVAGTHGKTTISALVAHILHNSRLGTNAFLGGISKNYNTNFLNNEASQLVVLEADEYDRSFLQLTPDSAVITSMDADHLDIYGTLEELVKEFERFAGRIKKQGTLIIKAGLPRPGELALGVKVYTYHLENSADFFATDVLLSQGLYHFNLVTPFGNISDLQLGIPGLLNVENAVASIALALVNGVTPQEIKDALPVFRGIARRFDVQVDTPRIVYIDDYAHHPQEIRATLAGIRNLYSKQRITGVFQPHLYTRTRDLAQDFADALSEFDEVVLLPVYPARELPIEGVDSSMIASLMKNTKVHLVEKDELLTYLENNRPRILVTMGAGDIDRLVPSIKKWTELLASK